MKRSQAPSQALAGAKRTKNGFMKPFQKPRPLGSIPVDGAVAAGVPKASGPTPAPAPPRGADGAENQAPPAGEGAPARPAAARPAFRSGLKMAGFKPPQRVGPPPAARPSTAAVAGGGGCGTVDEVESTDVYYTVLYTKRSNKKQSNKVFQDGVMKVAADNTCVLHNDEGKSISQLKIRGCRELGGGAELFVGSWEVEIDSKLAEDEFKSGRVFMGGTAGSPPPPATLMAMPRKAMPKSLPSSRNPQPQAPAGPRWLHNPDAEDALVLLSPDPPKGAPPGFVVCCDPYLCKNLRPHQREGVRFMYRCVVGAVDARHHGCILADEMGLGKTLQVLSLLWTLLKQGPSGKPLVRKAIVVAPTSLLANWGKETNKWLGRERLQAKVVPAGPEAGAAVQDFVRCLQWPVMVISYETIRKFAGELAGKAQLLVCDEGHRLKAAGGNKTILALQQLQCRHRVLLTGTPIQNQLDEFFAMIDFVCPSLLGELAGFKRLFAGPIQKSRDRSASKDDKALGRSRTQELTRLTSPFLLRRTQEINRAYLPAKSEYVVFCGLSPAQQELYAHYLRTPEVRRLMSPGSGAVDGTGVLKAIIDLRKLCNHPDLLLVDGDDGTGGVAEDPGEDGGVGGVVPFAPAPDPPAATAPDPKAMGLIRRVLGDRYEPGTVSNSGKLLVLQQLLASVRASCPGERCVIASGFVKALDLISLVCEGVGLRVVRLDGSTGPQKRQSLVDSFNNGLGDVFILSTRAGGVGLNLTGANRLVLFDSDWNPAVDEQAMARVWRDGQRRPVYIYRLLSSGSIEEKIFQRQLVKGEVAALVGGADGAGKGQSEKRHFSADEIKELLTLWDTDCDTRDLLERSGHGDQFKDRSAHLAGEDGALAQVVAAGHVRFVHRKSDASSGTPAPGSEEQDEEGGGGGGGASKASDGSDSASDGEEGGGAVGGRGAGAAAGGGEASSESASGWSSEEDDDDDDDDAFESLAGGGKEGGRKKQATGRSGAGPGSSSGGAVKIEGAAEGFGPHFVAGPPNKSGQLKGPGPWSADPPIVNELIGELRDAEEGSQPGGREAEGGGAADGVEALELDDD